MAKCNMRVVPASYGSESADIEDVGEAMTGDMLPRGWAISTVADVGSIRVGRQLSPEKLTGRHPTPYLRAANITASALDLDDVLEMDFTPEERAVYELRPGDVVLAEASGSPDQVGRSAVWTEGNADRIPHCCYQNTVIRFRPYAVRPEFALVVFHAWATNGDFAKLARGTGIQHLGSRRFGSLAFPVPPLEEQARIAEAVEVKRAEIFGARRSLDEALTHVRLQNEKIREGVLNGTLVEGSDPLVVPWTVSSLAQSGALQPGLQRTPGRLRGANPVPYLRAANIAATGIDLSVGVFEMDFTEDELSRYTVSAGDLVIAEASGSATQVGRAAICTNDVDGFGFQNTVIRYRPHSMIPQFALFVLRGLAADGAFARLAHGTGIQHLTITKLSEVEVHYPEVAVQQRLVAEAQRRLDASAEQERIAKHSLAMLSRMEGEIQNAAIEGRLVDQLDGVETGAELLRRVGQPPPEALERKAIRSARPTQGGHVASLVDILAAAGGALSVENLYRRAGYHRDVAADVERFYLDLRVESDFGTLRINDTGDETVVEVTRAS